LDLDASNSGDFLTLTPKNRHTARKANTL